MDYVGALEKLTVYHQEHLLRFYEELTENEKMKLLSQIEDIDFETVNDLKSHKYELSVGDLSPIETVSLDDTETRSVCREVGIEALSKGKMALIILAGGQGSRLGSRHAKGMYDIGITGKHTIFEIHIGRLLKFHEETGTFLHCFIMTSVQNDSEIRSFFEENNFFGYDREHIHFFVQSNIITVDDEYNLMLSDKSTICYSPNGNGRWYEDLVKNNYRELLDQCGIEWLNVVAVDNVLQELADPEFLGAVIRSSSSCGAKVVDKIDADEKIGTICINNGRPEVLEYYEIPDDLKKSVDNDGNLKYRYGVILNYILNVEKLDSLDYDKVPVHIVHKKVPYVDENGDTMVPDKENAWKFEYLLTDLVALMSPCISFEVDREKGFAPIKNLTGVDSVESARRLLIKNGYEL